MSNQKIPDKVKRALEAIDLTQYEISLYLTLVQEGRMNAKELSDASNVPYSRIYNILSLLLDKGFVQRDDSERPSVFIANPPDEALMLARKKLIDDFDEHSKVIVSQLNDIFLKNIDAPVQVPLIVYRGKDQVFRKASSLLESASESIMMALADLEDLASHDLLDIIKEKQVMGGVTTKILVEESVCEEGKHGELLEVLLELGEVRERDQIFGTGFAVDKRDAIIILKARIFGITSYFGMQSDHQAFGSVANYYFDYLFDTATHVELEGAGDDEGSKENDKDAASDEGTMDTSTED